MKRKLDTITLIGIDCLDIKRLNLAVEICLKDFDFADTKILTSLPIKNNKYVRKINHINSAEDYSRFIISELDYYIDTPHALIIQYDGFILNPKAWTDDFLQYDYIGAPWLVADWSVKNFDFPKDLLGKLHVGNGGFSLRSKKLISLCAELDKEKVFLTYHPEDVVICVKKRKFLEDRGIKFAPVSLAKKFSFEAEDDEHNYWDGQFGFHGLSWTDISKWTENHPEYKINNQAAIKSN